MLKKNIIANLSGKIWSAISVFIFIPIYIKFLGVDSYGLVGFYTTLLSVLTFTDIGFTATLNREMARLAVVDNSDSKIRDLLSTYELTYAFITFVLIISVWLMAPFIASDWLHNNKLPIDQVIFVIRLMGIAIAFQLTAGLYIGGLMGLQRQVSANSIQIFWSIFRSLGSVIVLWLIAPNILCFIVWQVISNLAYLILARTSLWNGLSSKPGIYFKRQVFVETWRYAIGMAGLSFLSILTLQADKLLVSKLMPLNMIGYYTLAGTLASLPVMLALPVTSAIFPRFANLVSLGDRDKLTELYYSASDVIALIAIPCGVTIAMFSRETIQAWTNSALIAQAAWPAASFLLLSNAITTLLLVPHFFVLAYGYLRLNVWIGVFSLSALIPMLFFSLSAYGLIGGGLTWFILNIIIMIVYMYFIHRKYQIGELKQWYIRSIARPLIVTLPIVGFARLIMPSFGNRILMLAFIGLVWLIAMLAVGLSNFKFRQNIFNKLSNYKG